MGAIESIVGVVVIAVVIWVGLMLLDFAKFRKKRKTARIEGEKTRSNPSSINEHTEERNRSLDRQPSERVMNQHNIFVSYRRKDSADITGRICDRLFNHFGVEHVFKDVDSIPLGVDFKDFLSDSVAKCEVMIAVIGDQWVTIEKAEGGRCLDNPADYVRIEIEAAIQRNIPIIPALVRGAKIPDQTELPESMQKLIFRNGIEIRPDPDFHKDLNRLIKGLENMLTA